MKKTESLHDDAVGTDAKPKDLKTLQLESLKAIRESAAFRWDKRRSYEWQLSLSIWTAAAAFSGVMLDKGFTFEVRDKWVIAGIVGACGAMIAVLHGLYVHNMVGQTMADVSIQRWCEQKIHVLAFSTLLTEKDEIPRELDFHPPMTSFRKIQIYITAILMAACVFSVLAPRPQRPDLQQTTQTNKAPTQK